MGSFEVAIQSEPLGMGECGLSLRDNVTTKNCLVVWGDQVGLRTETIRVCMRAHVLPFERLANTPCNCSSSRIRHPFRARPNGSVEIRSGSARRRSHAKRWGERLRKFSVRNTSIV